MSLAALIALIITLAIEVPIVALIFTNQRMRMAITCLFLTGVTNAFMNTVLIHLSSSYLQYILIGELGAVSIEAAIYASVSRPRDIARALLASAVANALSYGAGLWFFH